MCPCMYVWMNKSRACVRAHASGYKCRRRACDCANARASVHEWGSPKLLRLAHPGDLRMGVDHLCSAADARGAAFHAAGFGGVGLKKRGRLSGLEFPKGIPRPRPAMIPGFEAHSENMKCLNL